MIKKKKNRFSVPRTWKIIWVITAITIMGVSGAYTSYLARLLAESERRNVKLWAECTKLKTEVDDERFLDFLTDIQNNYTQIPAILTDSNNVILSQKGLDSLNLFTHKIPKYNSFYLSEQIKEMSRQHPRLEINTQTGERFFVYYQDSELLQSLKYFPYRQLGVIAIFAVLAYLSFANTRRLEQNKIWVGLAKETAHQLGTPISSLIAWLELLREKYDSTDKELFDEMDKDIERLNTITDRFSKIGSVPHLESLPIREVTEQAAAYLSKRISKKIKISVTGDNVPTLLSLSLYEWVIENLCKNAVNAIGNKNGTIDINIISSKSKVFIDIKDNGNGIPVSKFETIFEPGYTTRKRGWGLGLSLARRIIVNYHKGDIFILDSEIGKGTTFRIELNRAIPHQI